MALNLLKSTARELVALLAHGAYESVIARCANSRLAADDLRTVIRDYGRKLVPPPGDAYDNLDIVPVKGTAGQTWSVRVPLWTEEEGRSDLTLELTVVMNGARPSVELDDLHVL
jgi:hypothetical protein